MHFLEKHTFFLEKHTFFQKKCMFFFSRVDEALSSIHNQKVKMFGLGLAYQTSWRRHSLFNATRRQFHQHYMREFFVQTLFRQLFSSCMYGT